VDGKERLEVDFTGEEKEEDEEEVVEDEGEEGDEGKSVVIQGQNHLCWVSGSSLGGSGTFLSMVSIVDPNLHPVAESLLFTAQVLSGIQLVLAFFAGRNSSPVELRKFQRPMSRWHR